MPEESKRQRQVEDKNMKKLEIRSLAHVQGHGRMEGQAMMGMKGRGENQE